MNTLFSKYKWMQIVYGTLLVVAGILIIVLSFLQPTSMSKWLSVILAITLFIYASALMFTGIFSLKDKYFDIVFIYAALFVSLGIVLLINTDLLGSLIIYFVAALLTVAGVISVGQATAMVFFKRKTASIVIFYTLGAVFITLGVLCFCFTVEVSQFIYVATGAFVIAIALLELYLGLRHLRDEKKATKKAKKQVVDAEVIDNKEDIKQIEINENKDKIDA